MTQRSESGKKVQIEIQQLRLGHDFDYFKKGLIQFFDFVIAPLASGTVLFRENAFTFLGTIFADFTALCAKRPSS